MILTKKESKVKICSRPLDIPIIGQFFNHSYIDAYPHRYAIVNRCKPTDNGIDNILLGTTMEKTDHAIETDVSNHNCVPCYPKEGVDDITKCLHDAYENYNNPSEYKAMGPNSNTFIGNIARSCCLNMDTSPSQLGNVIGWNDKPAQKIKGVCSK